MTKTAYINARVNKKIKADAQKVFREVGVNTSDAVDMFLRQVVMQQGIPFEVCIPNKETREAIRELRDPVKRAKLKSYSSSEEMFADILGKDWRDKKYVA
jgi:DNA-damage-inducible protein J